MEQKTSEFSYDYMNLLDEKEASWCFFMTCIYTRGMIICWIVISLYIVKFLISIHSTNTKFNILENVNSSQSFYAVDFLILFYE